MTAHRGDGAVRLCSIATRNYLSRLRVMATSFLDHHPGAGVAVLLVDDVHGDVDAADEPFDVVRPADLDLEAEEFHRMATYYDVLELCTSLKPWLFRHLLRRDPASPVIYLDPDIRIYAPLTEIGLLARRHGIVLTPHVTTPMPRDGKLIDEDAILGSGIYNLGFIALTDDAQPFLDFWMERLRRDCRIDKRSQRFVDQRWVDLVPGLFDCHILRDPSYNVAYWNLDQRRLGGGPGRYTVEGGPLHFFHFSGFDPEVPDQLSRWQCDRPRVLLSERPDVAGICAEYAAALRASRRPQDGDPTYAFAELPNGVTLSRELRQLYWERVDAADRAGLALPPDPFTVGGAEELVAWLRSPARPGEGRLTRFLAFVHSRREDLRSAFPDPDGADYDRYLDWAESEVLMGRLHPRLVVGTRESLPAGEAPPVEAPELVRLARSRADLGSPTRFGFISRLARRVVARLIAHEDAHRAAVDARLAEALGDLSRRVDDLDSQVGLRASDTPPPASVPRQLAALEARLVERLTHLDARLRALSERVASEADGVALPTAGPLPHVITVPAPDGLRAGGAGLTVIAPVPFGGPSSERDAADA